MSTNISVECAAIMVIILTAFMCTISALTLMQLLFTLLQIAISCPYGLHKVVWTAQMECARL